MHTYVQGYNFALAYSQIDNWASCLCLGDLLLRLFFGDRKP